MCNKSIWLVVMALGLLAAPAVTRAQVVNLALNGSFEEDEVILDDPAWTMWATWGDGDGLNATVEIDDTEFIDGTKSLRVMPKGVENWQFIVLNLPIPLELGKTYTASFWAKAKEARPLTVQFKDTANKPVTWGQTTFQLTTEWAEYSMTSPAQDASMKLEFFCAASEVVFWLDFLNLYLGDYVPGIEPSEVGGSGKARKPVPADEAVDVPRDVVLSWMPAQETQGRNVYVGADLAAVENADIGNPLGVLAGENLTDATYTPAGLEYGKTYYWRVDEIGLPPDSSVLKGDVWQFTVEPYAYPITNVTATASSFQPGVGPENTVNGSGLNADDEHSTELTQMWMATGAQPNWIQYEFDAPYKLYELWVWNSNQLIESFIGFGARDVIIEYSVDGATWTKLGDVHEFARATGAATYKANTIVDLGGVVARYVKLTIEKSWGGVAPQTGLSEVRFFQTPVQARQPTPADGAADVSLDAELNWRPGREATSHTVFLGTDAAAVTAGTAAASTVTEHRYTPPAMNFGTEYFWKVNEVGDAGTYEGDVWSFVSQEFEAIDDFEGYNDDDNRIYQAWIDGVTTGASGSTVGYMAAPFAEKTIVHAGKQAMPLLYDNSAAPFLSEAELTFGTARNFTANGADSLVVWFRGQAPGFAELANGNIVMSAIGADIWNNADEFRYAYKTLNGDGSMVARVESIVNSDAWAKGGVMIRQSIEPGSVHAFMPITPGGSGGGNGASFQHRLVTTGSSTNNDNTGGVVAAPYWVKIVRKGNDFSGYISPDGATWTQLGTAQTIPMTGPVLIGLALCSHDAALSTSAEFSNIATTGNVTGSWQVAEIGVPQPEGNSIEGLYLAIEDSAGKTKVVQYPDAAATAMTSWQQWRISLSEFTPAGVKMNAVKKLTIGVGNKAAPAAGGAGMVFLDDIGYGRSAP